MGVSLSLLFDMFSVRLGFGRWGVIVRVDPVFLQDLGVSDYTVASDSRVRRKVFPEVALKLSHALRAFSGQDD